MRRLGIIGIVAAVFAFGACTGDETEPPAVVVVNPDAGGGNGGADGASPPVPVGDSGTNNRFVTLTTTPISVTVGKTVTVTVTIARTGFEESFELKPASTIAGLTVPTTTVPANVSAVTFEISAIETLKHGPREIPLVASVVEGGTPITIGNGKLVVEVRGVSGALDTGFGADGFGGTSVPFQANASAAQSDGKIIVAGARAGIAGGAVARFDATTGALDTSFGTANTGIVLSSFVGQGAADQYQQWTHVVVDAMNRIIVGGLADVGGQGVAFRRLVVARLLATGAPDLSFGDPATGVATIDVPSRTNERLRSLLALPDNSILVGGVANATGTDQGLLLKLTPAGALDSFAPDLATGNYPLFNVTALGATATSIFAASDDFQVRWFTNTGTLKASAEWGSDVGTQEASHIGFQSDGKVIIAGAVDQGTDNNATLSTRFLASDSPVNFDIDIPWGANSEGSHEEKVCDRTQNNENARGLVVQPDNKVVVATSVRASCDDVFSLGVSLIRYTAQGALDNTFGSNGRVQRSIVGLGAYVLNVHANAAGQLTVVAFSQRNADLGVELMRFWP